MSAAIRRGLLAAGAVALAAAVVLVVLFRPDSTRFYTVPHFWPMTAAKLSTRDFRSCR